MSVIKHLLILMGTVGCFSCAHSAPVDDNPATSPTYTIVIDSEFSSNEQSSIAGGFDAWQTAVGRDLTFSYVSADRSDIDNVLAGNPPANTIYALFVADITTIDCFIQASNVACFKTPNKIYFQTNLIEALDVWPKIAAHEAGHAIGLQHSPVPFSVMQADIDDMSSVPLPSDVDQYCEQQSDGCPHRVTD